MLHTGTDLTKHPRVPLHQGCGRYLSAFSGGIALVECPLITLDTLEPVESKTRIAQI